MLSSAVSVRSAARPKACSRGVGRRTIGSSAAGGRSPPTDRSAVGRPAATSGPCSPTVTGKASRAHCDVARAPPGLVPRLLAHGGLDGAAQLQRADAVAGRPAGYEGPAHRGARQVAEHEDGVAGCRAARPGRARPRARRCRRWWRRTSRCASAARRARRARARASPRCPRARRARRAPAASRWATTTRPGPGWPTWRAMTVVSVALAVDRLGVEGRRGDLVGAHRAEGGGEPRAQRGVARVAGAARRDRRLPRRRGRSGRAARRTRRARAWCRSGAAGR